MFWANWENQFGRPLKKMVDKTFNIFLENPPPSKKKSLFCFCPFKLMYVFAVSGQTACDVPGRRE